LKKHGHVFNMGAVNATHLRLSMEQRAGVSTMPNGIPFHFVTVAGELFCSMPRQ